MDESHKKLLAEDKKNEDNLAEHPLSRTYPTFDALKDVKATDDKEAASLSLVNRAYVYKGRAEKPPKNGKDLIQESLPQALVPYIKSFNSLNDSKRLEATSKNYYGKYPEVARLPNTWRRIKQFTRPYVPAFDIEAPHYRIGGKISETEFIRLDLTRPQDLCMASSCTYQRGSTSEAYLLFVATLSISPTLFCCCSPCLVMQACGCCYGAIIGANEDFEASKIAEPIKNRRRLKSKAGPQIQVMQDGEDANISQDETSYMRVAPNK